MCDMCVEARHPWCWPGLCPRALRGGADPSPPVRVIGVQAREAASQCACAGSASHPLRFLFASRPAIMGEVVGIV
jgi:hypothetical protein